MERSKLVLAAMSPALTGPFTPVQVQKLFFLLDEGVGKQTGGPHFSFLPYDYGPFDKEVYHELEALQAEGLVEVSEGKSYGRRTYRLTEQGLKDGEAALSEIEQPLQTYVDEVVSFVRRLSFPQLVSAIYKAYPEMQRNSVFFQEAP